jgi:hypothetical protein
MPKVSGRAFRRDGTQVAQWSSDATSVLAAEGRLYFRFTGDHPPARPRKGKENSEEYRGFSEYIFDPPLEHPAHGRGALWDLNLPRGTIRARLTLALQRCTVDGDIEAMSGSDRARIADVVQRVLPPPSRPRSLTAATRGQEA